MGKHEYPLLDLDEFVYRISSATAILEVVHMAMETGPNEAASYLDALYGAYDYLNYIQKEMRECVEQLASERRAEVISCTKEAQ